MIEDPPKLNLAEEVLPLTHRNMSLLKRDAIFWGVSFFAGTPLLIATSISNPDYQVRAFAILFSLLWAVVFKKLIVYDTSGLKYEILSWLFTSTVGMGLLLSVHGFFPSFYRELPHHQNSIAALVGFVFQVGLWEELCKILPVLIFLKLKMAHDARIGPANVVLIGAFSGLGFATAENVHYVYLMIQNAVQTATMYGNRSLAVGTAGAMIGVMVRNVSLVFCHALWSGIFAYFLARSARNGRIFGSLFLMGWAVAAVLHGLYDWFSVINSALSAVTVGVSFMLFYAYMSKLEGMLRPAGHVPDPSRAGMPFMD